MSHTSSTALAARSTAAASCPGVVRFRNSETAARARESFFKPQNLTALRELALAEERRHRLRDDPS